jgi:replicative DNA helicase
VDELTLKAQGANELLVDTVGAAVPNLGHLESYCQLVLEAYLWRTRKEAALRILDAFEGRNEEGYAQAEQLLAAPQKSSNVWTKDRLQDALVAELEAGAVEAFPWPFFKLNELVQMTRGSVTLVGGWTSHGKTTFVDQIARLVSQDGSKVWAWINEMTPQERARRQVSALSGIDLTRVLRNRLEAADYPKYMRALEHLPYEIVDAAGWSMEEISRDIRQRRPDLAIVDILHLIPYKDERDMARISQVLNACAKQADCHILATVHLNERFVVGADRPQPHLGTIKAASALKQDADNVLFVWREDDPDTGLPTTKGQIYFAKARQGQVGGVPVLFDGEHSTFNLDEEWQ